MNSETENCQNCRQNFIIDPDDFTFYEKMQVPPPTWCPQCRMQRRMVFRNERKLFRGVDAITGQKILTLYPAEAGYTIYDTSYWLSDAWDPGDYAQDVDFSRPFLAQVFELNKKVPKDRASALSMVNSDYSANAGWLKNCYLLFNSNNNEDCAYGNGVDKCRNCFDNSHIKECEKCYQSFWLTKSYETHFSARCEDCFSLWFSKDCRGCNNCVGCVNLRNKSYCIFNQQYSKSDYEDKLKSMRLDTWSGLRKTFEESQKFWLKHPNKFLQGTHNTDVSGEFITHSKNVHQSYLIRECRDLKYCQYSQVPSSQDSHDVSLFGCNSDLMYESSVCGWGAARIKFCDECWDEVHDMEYSMFCRRSSNLFGCEGMKDVQYCILNKQYNRQDYEDLVAKIKTQMTTMPYIDKQGREYRYGEFFPPEFSPFAYNQTIAPEHIPLTKEEAIAQGFGWQDPSPNEYKITMEVKDIPDSINDVGEDILQEVIKCLDCSKAYRLIAAELQFLKQHHIAASRICVDCRHLSRINQRNPAKFYHRACMKPDCQNEFETSYSPERKEIVYCEKCYQAEVA